MQTFFKRLGMIPVSFFYLRRRNNICIITEVKSKTAMQIEISRRYSYINRNLDGFDSRYLLEWIKPVNIREIRKNLISTGFSNVKSQIILINSDKQKRIYDYSD